MKPKLICDQPLFISKSLLGKLYEKGITDAPLLGATIRSPTFDHIRDNPVSPQGDAALRRE